MNEFDVVICISWKDVYISKKNIEFIRENIKPDIIYIICSKSLFKFFKKSFLIKYHIILLDEDNLVKDLTFKYLFETKESLGRNFIPVGWYFQQFLKMSFALSKYAKEQYLIWDADTIPTRKLSIFNKENRPYFTLKNEYHKPYFDEIFRLINIKKIINESFISEHMLIKTEIMKELVNKINNNKHLKGSNWVEKILGSVNTDTKNGFSEFETYGTYCLYFHSLIYSTRSLKTMRRGGLLYGRIIRNNKLRYVGNNYDTISFESGDYPKLIHLYIIQKIQMLYYMISSGVLLRKLAYSRMLRRSLYK